MTVSNADRAALFNVPVPPIEVTGSPSGLKRKDEVIQ